MAPKIGPRGVTIDDVQDVATNGISQTVTSPYRSARFENAQPAFSAPDLASMLASQRQPGYGQKYAGFPTASMMELAILGSALGFKDLGTYAANQRDILAEPAQQAFNDALDTSKYNSLLSKQLSTNRQIVGRGISEDPQLIAAQKALNNFYVSQGAKNTLNVSRPSISYSSSGIPTTFNIPTTPRSTPEGQNLAAQLANAQYGANMARLNAVRGTGDYDGNVQSQIEANALAQVTPQAEAARQAALRSSGAVRADEIARGINNLPVSQLAQIMASSYGLDPNIARAMFGAQTDVDYARAQESLDLLNSGIDPGMTEAEMILTYEGPEALTEWQAGKANAALYGTPDEQLQAQQDEIDAQTAIFDLQIQNTYGVSPKNVTGVDPQIARQLFQDANFTGWIDAGMAELQNADGTKSPDQIIGELGSQYLTDKPMGKVEAIALVEVLSNWKFLANAGA